MTEAERRKQKLRTQCASASDDKLRYILQKSSSFDLDTVSIAAEGWISRPEGQKIHTHYDSESDEALLAILKSPSSYPSDVIVTVSAILILRGCKLPDNTPEPKQLPDMARIINRMERVALSGGIIGWLGTNPRSALEQKMKQLNAEGWNCRQIMPHGTRNGLIVVIQALVLVCTLFLWTFEPGYLLLFEKDSRQ